MDELDVLQIMISALELCIFQRRLGVVRVVPHGDDTLVSGAVGHAGHPFLAASDHHVFRVFVSLRHPHFDGRVRLDPLPKRQNKSVESNVRVDLSLSFHVVREFDLAAGWRCPPVPHLLR